MPKGVYKRPPLLQIEQVEQLLADGKSRSKCEIAEKLGVRIGSVTTCLQRANKRLSDYIPLMRKNMRFKRQTILDGLSARIIPSPWHHWFAGLVAGEGCFSIYLFPSKLNNGISATTTFSLRFHICELPMLEDIKSRLAINTKIYTSGTACQLSIRDTVMIATRIVPIFNSTPLRGSKAEAFELFKDALRCKTDYSLENSSRLVDIYKSINTHASNQKQTEIRYDEEKQWFSLARKVP